MNAHQPSRRILLEVLRDPATVATLPESAWSALMASARDANLLGALAVRLAAAGIVPPVAVRRHLDGVRGVGERQQLSIEWEAQQLHEAVVELGLPVMLLKGAAYALGYPEIGEGRLFGDIDILVPRQGLGDVEARLMLHGWVTSKSDPYDQHYYREWMHELPPMTHLRRGTVLDVHHNILPQTARHSPDASAILGRSLPLARWPALRIPSPEDLLIHSLTHALHEGELHNVLRDLHDAAQMMRQFSGVAGFWDRLHAVAAGNDLAGPVALGLQLTARFFGAPLPQSVAAALEASGPGVRGWLRWRRRYETALLAPMSGPVEARVAWARFRLYVRAHALRMPTGLLVRHLARKAWMRRRAESAPIQER